MLLLFLFITYLIVNYLLDTMSLQELKAVTVGTTSGIVFALFSGFVASYSLSIIYNLRQSRKTYNLSFAIGIGYILFTIWLTRETLQFHLTEIRSDIFLIDNQEGFYQRVGNFFLIQFMMTGALATILLLTSKKLSIVRSSFLLIVYSLSAFLFATTSQLIGSNSGFVGVVGFLLVFYVYFFILLIKKNTINQKDIKLRRIIFGRIGRAILQGSLIVLLIGFILAMFLSDYIDFDRFRFSGFGSGENSSVSSRIELFKNNFLNHLSYNPIFGNTQVEKLTTGEGTYVHSLISIATHLGIVGLLIFITMIYYIYKDITNISITKSTASLYCNKNYGLYRLFSLGVILLFALLISFYTWLPLWFAIGLFGISLVDKR